MLPGYPGPGYPVRFTPRGISDALDATDKFPGACVALTDLIFDQLNPELMVARPGVEELADFAGAGFASPGVISVQITVGNVTYGMIASALNTGKDQPFAYNNATESFVSITGITNANSPATPTSTGAWTPPTMAVIGTVIVVTHPGFSATASKIGFLDISTPSAPVWSAGDTATNALPSIPTAVANFRNRAYYACGQFLPFSDVLAANTRTNSSQVLTVGDTSDITALSGLPVQTTSSGVIGALIAWKASQVWQITGDSVTSDLALNYLSLTIGTRAPRSVVQCQYGLYFVADGGPYIIDKFAGVRPLTFDANTQNPDVQAPFQNAVVPSRAAACYSASIYRICLETIIRGVQGFNDYWFDERRRRWTGPHTFRFDCASQYLNYMILASNDNPGFLYKSQLQPDSTSQYLDDTTVYTPRLQSATFPKSGSMTQDQVIESTIELANAGQTTTYNIQALDDQDNTLDSVNITVLNSGSTWGSFVWGDGTLYTSTTNRPRVYNVNWTQPIVFQKMAILIQANASSALSIGTFFARFQEAGYINVPNPADGEANTTGTPLDAETEVPILI